VETSDVTGTILAVCCVRSLEMRYVSTVKVHLLLKEAAVKIRTDRSPSVPAAIGLWGNHHKRRERLMYVRKQLVNEECRLLGCDADVSEELTSSIRVERINELGTMLAVTSN
jgi:hypothetical protein